MRKLIAIPLLVLYITAVSGMMIQLHFCGDKLLSWKVNESKTASCCGDTAGTAATEKTVEEEGCCKDKTITLKIKQEQNRVSQLQLQLSALQSVPATASFIIPETVALIRADVHTAYRANAPPGLWQNIPLYKLHTRFTYYG